MFHGLLSILFFAFVLVSCGDDKKFNIVDSYDDEFSEKDLSSSSFKEDKNSETSEKPSSSSSEEGVSSAKISSSGALDSAAVSSSSSKTASSSSGTASSSSMDASCSSSEGPAQIYNPTIKYDTAFDIRTQSFYPTIQIGSQIWLAQNLNVSSTSSKCYDDNKSNCSTYGRLYNESSPVCPNKFNLPTEKDWKRLFETAGATASLLSGQLWKSGENAGTNELGFALLPAGTCTQDSCYGLGETAYLLAANGSGYFTVSYSQSQPEFHSGFNRELYYSVRCVQTATEIASIQELPDECENGATMKVGSSRNFTCKNSAWLENFSSRPSTCTAAQEGTRGIYNATEMVCKSKSWYFITDNEKRAGICSSANEGDTATIFGNLYACHDLSWKYAKIEDVYGACEKYESSEITEFDGYEYACMDSTWTKLGTLDKRYGLCLASRFGELIDSSTVYVCKNHKWSVATIADRLGECDDKKYLTKVDMEGKTYVCNGTSWIIPKTITDAYGKCLSRETTEIIVFNNSKYICMDSVWSYATILDERYGICTDKRSGEIIDSTKNFVCKNHRWVAATKLETLGDCSSKKQMSTDKYNDTLFVCKNGSWVKPNALETKYGLCTDMLQGSKKDGYICDANEWRTATALEYYGPCTAALQDTILGTEICDEGSWRKATSTESRYGFCTKTLEGKKSATSTYICTKGTWEYVDAMDYAMGLCNANNLDKQGVYRDTIYNCQWLSNSRRYVWMNSKVNAILGTCTQDIYGTTKIYKNQEYLCKTSAWRTASSNEEKALGFCTVDREQEMAEYNGILMYCSPYFSWEAATKNEILGECTSSNYGQTKNFYDQKYECREYGWKAVYNNFTDSRDNQTYATVIVNGVEWLAENVNYETEGSWCYSNIQGNCNSYGRLYTYEAAQKACPAGWHMPSHGEGKTSPYARSYTYKAYETWQGENRTGYSELNVTASGLRNKEGNFEYMNRVGGFWYNVERNSDSAFVECYTDASSSVRNFCYGNMISVPQSSSTYPYAYAIPKEFGFPVRCIKD